MVASDKNVAYCVYNTYCTVSYSRQRIHTENWRLFKIINYVSSKTIIESLGSGTANVSFHEDDFLVHFNLSYSIRKCGRRQGNSEVSI